MGGSFRSAPKTFLLKVLEQISVRDTRMFSGFILLHMNRHVELCDGPVLDLNAAENLLKAEINGGGHQGGGAYSHVYG